MELYNEKDEEEKKDLTILALDGVVPAKPVPADAAAKPVAADEVKELLLMPASRAEIYVRNDDELHEEEEVYILRTKGLNAGTDWWPEIQLARIVLKPNKGRPSETLVGLNAPIATEEPLPPPEETSRMVRAEEPKRPDGCLPDLNPALKEHRRVTFSGQKDPELKTEWMVETEIVRPPADAKEPEAESLFTPLTPPDDATIEPATTEPATIGPIPFEAYKNKDGRIDWEGKGIYKKKPTNHVCVKLDAGGNSHKQQPKHRALAIMFASVMLAGATQSSDAIAKDVHIIKKGNVFLFKEDEAAITIQKGETVRWIVQKGTEREHHLMGKPPTNGFKEIEPFTEQTDPPVNQTFEKAAEFPYECIIHDTMQGKITVK